MNNPAPLLKPYLYSGLPDGGATLSGGRCGACGHTFFPMQDRGCERCGAHGEQLSTADLGGTGTLVSAAVVHLHAGKGRTAPFVVGVIDLDSGPRIRALLHDLPDAESATGARLSACLVDIPTDAGDSVSDLRFRRA